MTARLVLALLLDCRNSHTGQCNPKRKTLAAALGRTPRTIARALNELRAAELIRSKPGHHTNIYEILDGFQVGQNVPPGGRQVGQNVPLWKDKMSHLGSRILYEPIEGEPSVRGPKPAPASLPKRKSISSETLARYYELYGKAEHQ